MKLRTAALFGLPLLLALGGCGDDTPGPDVVATAGSVDLTVDDVVDLLVDQEDLPATAELVEAIAGLWIDYTLLARVGADDPELTSLDFGPMVRASIDQEILFMLRDSVVQVDTIVSDADLRTRYDNDDESLRFRARHIMLQYPVEATAAQRDSVRGELAALRDRIGSGASFEELARTFSQDPGSRAQGGDLGFFSPGELVQPFEDAVRALEPGQVSDVVETPMGLHLIRLEERERPDFDAVSVELADRILVERAVAAESLFVAGVEERAGEMVVAEGAAEILRDLAGNPSVRLSSRAARRPLVEWNGGALTAGRGLELLRLEPPAFHDQVAAGADEPLGDFLQALARRELLVAEGRRLGLDVPQARADSLAQELRGQVAEQARLVGLLPVERAPGEDLDPAVRRAVRSALQSNLSGATQTVPLGPATYQLRSRTPAATLNAGVGRAVLELGRQRAARGLSDLESGQLQPPTPDTAAP